jgi:hypothetical protein
MDRKVSCHISEYPVAHERDLATPQTPKQFIPKNPPFQELSNHA